jgi:hypothetical protein
MKWANRIGALLKKKVSAKPVTQWRHVVAKQVGTYERLHLTSSININTINANARGWMGPMDGPRQRGRVGP